MPRVIILWLIPIALIAAACGDDAASTSVGADPTTPDDSSDPTVAPDNGGNPTVVPDDGDPPLGAGPYPIADLTVTIQPDGPDGASRIYRLACLGDTATFTGDSGSLDAPNACLALLDSAVRDRLLLDAPADRICTEIYGGPQLALVVGTLDGEPVDTTVDRANGCGINDYDVVLAALLTPAGG